MRIAYVFDQELPSTETDTEQALNTVAALSRQGAAVTLVLPRPLHREAPSLEALREYYQVQGPFELRRVRGLSPAPRVLEKLGHGLRAAASRTLRRDFDLIYTRNIPTLLSGLATGLRVAYETYRPWPDQHPALGAVLAAAMRRERFVAGIFHSEYALRSYVRAGAHPAKLAVVHNGYDPARFEPPLSREEARQRLGLPLDRTIATYTGRVSMRKGLGMVLEMARRMPHVLFLVVGSEGHGEVEERAEALANVRVEPWATFDELPPWLFASDVLLVPPTLGPLAKVGNTVLPMKLFLYLAAGRAILAPRAPDTAELLEHERNSLLVEPDDLEAAIAALSRLADEPGLAERIGASAREQARDLTWDARARRILAALSR